MAQRLRSTRLLAVLTVLLTLSAGIIVLQAQRIRSLTGGEATTPAAIGQVAGKLVGLSLDGLPRDVSLRATVPTVVYFFSPTCGFCERNWPNIEALQTQAAGRYRVIGVTAFHGLRGYVEARRLGIDVIEGISDNSRQSFGFSGAPHTIVVSAEGLITREWRGAFTARIERQVEELFGIALPGVSPNPTAAGTRAPQ